MQLTIRDISKAYPNGVQALNNVSLTIPVLHDLVAANTYWELSATQARARKAAADRWNVTVDLRVRKYVVDDAGAEIDKPLNDSGAISCGAAKPCSVRNTTNSCKRSALTSPADGSRNRSNQPRKLRQQPSSRPLVVLSLPLPGLPQHLGAIGAGVHHGVAVNLRAISHVTRGENDSTQIHLMVRGAQVSSSSGLPESTWFSRCGWSGNAGGPGDTPPER